MEGNIALTLSFFPFFYTFFIIFFKIYVDAFNPIEPSKSRRKLKIFVRTIIYIIMLKK